VPLIVGIDMSTGSTKEALYLRIIIIGLSAVSTVIISSSYYEFAKGNGDSSKTDVRPCLAEHIHDLAEDKQVVLLGGSLHLPGLTAQWKDNDVKTLINRYEDNNLELDRDEQYAGQREFQMKLQNLNINPHNYHFINTEDQFCDESKCYLGVGEFPVLRNATHMHPQYSKTLGPWLTEQFRAFKIY
jgi:hypothetical protein